MSQAAPRSLLAADSLSLLLVAGVAAGGAWLARGYGLWSYGEPGPGLFPFVVCLATVLFAALSLAARAAGFAQDKPAADDEQAEGEGPVLWAKLLTYIATVLVWPLLLTPLGFLLSTTLALTVILRGAERASWAQTALLVAGAVLVSWLVFERVLGVPLPRGLFG